MKIIRRIVLAVGLLLVDTWALAEVPKTQQQFSNLISEYSQKYDNAKNELKKSSVLKDRDADLKTLLPDLKFDKWVLPIKRLGTTGDGNAYFTLGGDGFPFTIGTHNNEFSDSAVGTLIKHGSPLYNVLSELEVGNEVIVSGKILTVIALTERGKMVDPDFIVKFSSIELVK